jgi:hypothetical protein
MGIGKSQATPNKVIASRRANMAKTWLMAHLHFFANVFVRALSNYITVWLYVWNVQQKQRLCVASNLHFLCSKVFQGLQGFFGPPLRHNFVMKAKLGRKLEILLTAPWLTPARLQFNWHVAALRRFLIRVVIIGSDDRCGYYPEKCGSEKTLLSLSGDGKKWETRLHKTCQMRCN